MGLVYSEYGGGLLVAERGMEPDSVRRVLRGIDRDLILVRDFDPSWRQVVWQIRHRVSGDGPPLLVLEWRDPGGKPRPLASGILDALRAQQGRGLTLVRETLAKNDGIRERARREFDHAADETAADLGPRIEGRRSTPAPRSQALRIARDRLRAKGRNV